MVMQFIYPVTHHQDVNNFPVPGQGQKYGDSRSYGWHEGADFSAYTGQPIYASANGVVVDVFPTWQPGGHPYGVHVWLDHGDGWRTTYAHCKELKVSKGETVKQGQLIALADNTGNSSGNHLHFNITEKVNGVVYYRDPMLYLSPILPNQVGTIPALPADAERTYTPALNQNIRHSPAIIDGNVLTTLRAGSLIYLTGETQNDNQGYRWLEIASGQDVNGVGVGGAWIALDYTQTIKVFGKVGLL